MPRALVVDDLPQNRYMLETLLRGNDYQVVSVANGAEAIESARRDPPDLVISDVLMPVMDGFSLCRAWKQDPQLQSIPFVFYTATYTDPKDEHLAMSLGADRFIVKPIEPEAFVSSIRAILDKQRRHQLQSRVPEATNELGCLKEYSETLVRKLEHKVNQLEETNRALSVEIAERRRLECLRDDFLATAAHELKTPITTIKGYTQLLERWAAGDARPARERVAVATIDAQCDRIQRRVDQMLTAARYRTGLSPVRVERFDLGALTRDVVRRLQATTDTHRIVVQTPDVVLVEADQDRLDEAVATLLDRMLRAVVDGEDVHVRVGVQSGEARLSITGRGLAVPSDQEAAYFEPLYQCQPAVGARHLPVADLGPYLARLAVERQRGRVWLEKGDRDESTFVVQLPLVET